MVRKEKIDVRVFAPDDKPALDEICRHPLVVPHQYRVGLSDASAIWLARLNANVGAESFEWNTSTIFSGTSIVGYITEFRTLSKGSFSVQLGWNLHPDYWGHGIMTTALSKHISTLFQDDDCCSVIADCFSDNERCLRLLNRLGFKQSPIRRMERFLTCVVRMCPRKVLRHCTTSADWAPISHAV